MPFQSIPDTVAIHRVDQRIQFVFTSSYDKNIGMDAHGNPIRLGQPLIVTKISDVVLDFDRAVQLRHEVARGGSFVQFDYCDYRRGDSVIRVRDDGNTYDDHAPHCVSLTVIQEGINVAIIFLNDLQRESFLFALDNAIVGEESGSCLL